MIFLFLFFILPQLLLARLLFGSHVWINTENRSYDFGRQGTRFHQEPPISAAYECLGVSPQATDDEVKSAYRKLVMMYHPDRYATQGPAAQVHAQDKFLKVQKAYEEIKKLRNIV